jgi:hypothetical protein
MMAIHKSNPRKTLHLVGGFDYYFGHNLHLIGGKYDIEHS